LRRNDGRGSIGSDDEGRIDEEEREAGSDQSDDEEGLYCRYPQGESRSRAEKR
jgi:hypothetical protein